jgi:CheY-like chemotaxis protein
LIGNLWLITRYINGSIAIAKPLGAGMQPSRHILFVDDDPVFLSSMAEALRREGYRVTPAGHFNPALTALEDATDKPDVLVTDIVMPGSVNGVALARMARLRHHKISAVYMSGYDIPGVDREAFGPVLRKPMEPAELIAAIEAEFARLGV